MVAEVWLLLAVINGQEVYLDTFHERWACRNAALQENFVERAVQIEGLPMCRQFTRGEESRVQTPPESTPPQAEVPPL